MPRGVPNAKKDELGMRYTTFNTPLLANPKLTASTYLKYDYQTIWARNAANKSRGPEEAPEGRRGSKVLVIHPGSRSLRIGRASDVVPITVPHVIARKQRQAPIEPPANRECIERPKEAEDALQEGMLNVAKGDPVDAKIEAIGTSLRDRMKFYKLRIVPNASVLAANFNGMIEGEEAPNPYPESTFRGEVVVGERVYELPENAHLDGYAVKWPLYAGRFNNRDYKARQHVLDDLETIWSTTITEKLGISRKSFGEYSVVLVIPDIWDRTYVDELVDMLLVRMSFKQIACQQESLAATYGAGISNACVVDLGAVKTSVACVDDGLVLNETRVHLSIGGDDISEFLYVLLNRIRFPYGEMDLNCMYDWAMIEDLKCRICTLNENDVGLNLYDFWVRKPRRKPVKFGLRAYDEVILAPMLLFEPRVVQYEKKRAWLQPSRNPGITDEQMEFVSDQLSSAMFLSTQHLLPQAPQPALVPHASSEDTTPLPPDAPNRESGSKAEVIDVDAGMQDVEETKLKSEEDASSAKASAVQTPAPGQEQEEPGVNQASTDQNKPESSLNAAAGPTTDNNNSNDGLEANPTPAVDETIPATHGQEYLGGYAIDIPYEAGKLPLDVAIFNSARAAGGDDRIRKYLQAVLLIGGGALTPGMAHAVESRLQAIATPLVPNMEKVQIIPSPKDVDPRMLAWKGAAVLGKMDAVSDLWVTTADWNTFGMRALKERCFYLQY